MAVQKTWEGRTLREVALPKGHRVSLVGIQDVLTDSMHTGTNPAIALLDSHTYPHRDAEENLTRLLGAG